MKGNTSKCKKGKRKGCLSSNQAKHGDNSVVKKKDIKRKFTKEEMLEYVQKKRC